MKESPREINANLVQLDRAKNSSDISNALNELLKYPEALSKVVDIVLKKIAEGYYIADIQLVDLIAVTHDKLLYKEVKDRLINTVNIYALIKLYISEYPDPNIENTLSDYLWNESTSETGINGGSVEVASILKAMQLKGADDLLPILDAILHKKEPLLFTKKLVVDAIESNVDIEAGEALTMEQFDALADSYLMKKSVSDLLNAIREIKSRGEKFRSEVRLLGIEYQNPNNIDNAASNRIFAQSVRSGGRNCQEIINMISEGEGMCIEFKQTLMINAHTGDRDKNIEEAALKTIVAFLNTEGGTLLIGVEDYGRIMGIESDLRYKGGKDKLLLHLKELIKSQIGLEYMTYLNFYYQVCDNNIILVVSCNKSTSPCFLNKLFYMRAGPSSELLNTPNALEYIKNHFP